MAQLVTSLPAGTAVPSATKVRVASIDVVRGLVMVIMALDHIREFWSPSTVRPEDVTQASVALFFTRWVTHFCAPTFVFLSGVSIYLYAQKQPNRGRVSRFLLTRGLWLVALELIVITFLLQWSHQLLVLEVIWAIGWAMVLLAGLIWLPRPVLVALAVLIIGGHNLLAPTQPVTAGNWWWALLHNPPGVVALPPLPPLLEAYAVLPWTGVMLAGYLIGPWFRAEAGQRQRWLVGAGAALLVLFVGLRLLNGYGDPQPWSVQPRGALYTVLSFLNVQKYPPSLLFLSLTLGVALLLLAGLERATGAVSRVLRTFGQVPFFYFLLHLALISGSAWVWTRLAFGQAVNFGFEPQQNWPAAYTFHLWRAYLVWAVLVLLIYWPCRWYARYKQQHAYWWLSYL
ncbi:DUF1624 domain-containing protein [Hymenobacter sp. CRA2]|uniref:DUF1624 domain-containing protein n=1 Tax=Hymenobacter sp. CRA2 TaxID=1955620 RepID=UPI00098F3CB4|nr:heparan-alpha-glucosaminide N-acetyltransferase domain-containing protein [Hymenobacter sp. CRA2]OON67121.1 hypothetical protein B0919_20045 [Hymenobacter sp. CRA2]